MFVWNGVVVGKKVQLEVHNLKILALWVVLVWSLWVSRVGCRKRIPEMVQWDLGSIVEFQKNAGNDLHKI